MDHKTIEVYRQNSGFFANKYLNANNGITKYFSRSFINHSKILDIGCGVGKELNFLLSKGYDAIGIDPCEKLIEIGAEFYPKIKGRVFVDNIPELRSIKQDFDGIICSSVLMHIPSIQLFDVVLSIKEHLKPNGNFLFSIPNNYPIFDLKESRDASGRLYNGVTKNQLILLCERIGFRVIETWDDESVIDNTVVVWQTVLLKFNAGNDTRSLDSIEGIINNDQKVATYKLALFRALAELATTNPKAAKWSHSGVVLLPLDLVIDKWIDYYWKIFESEIFIPQIQNESETYSKPVSFRKLFNQLIIRYRNSGGYEGFNVDRLKLTLTPDHFEPYGSLRAKMKLTIIKGPVTHAGGVNSQTKIFGYDQKGNIIIPDLIWKELSLLGAWIIDASILRWAELTSKFSKGMLKPSEIIDLLLKDERTRQIDDAKKIYFNHKHELICTWTSSVLSNFEIDHIIPFSLWKNNDLWNLVPTSPKVNREKSDKIVTISLINRAKDNILDNWRFFVKADDKRFFNEAKILTGSYINRSNWENDLFAGLKEAVECTAIQRGIKRWEPKTSTSSQ